MTPTLLGNGVWLTAYGMGTVFVFLILLIYATRAMSLVVGRLLPPPVERLTEDGDRIDAQNPSGEAELIAVIGAAVRQYRIRRGN